MMKQTNLRGIGSLVLLTIALLFIADIQAIAQKKDYTPGEKIEWKSSNYPETWEEATFVEATPDGTQPIIREKPNQFHKDGFQQATSWAKIRPLSAKTTYTVPVNDTEADNATTPQTTSNFGTGLMTREQVLRFLQAKIGNKPFTDPPREAEFKKELAEMIKRRGLNFRFTSSDTVFWKKLSKYGGLTGELNFPLRDNYGPPTKQAWLMGTWKLGKIGAAVDYVKNNRVYRQGEIGVGNIGTLSINSNGTFIWKSVLTTRPKSGKWRKAAKAEMKSQGGDGVVLLKAQSGYAWIVTKDRTTTLKGEWINISELETRQINEFGSRGGKI